MRRRDRVLVVLAGLAFVVTGSVHGLAAAADPGGAGHRHMAQTRPAAPPSKAAGQARLKVAKKSPAAEYTPTVRLPSPHGAGGRQDGIRWRGRRHRRRRQSAPARGGG